MQVTVFYIDYGNTEKVEKTDVFLMDSLGLPIILKYIQPQVCYYYMLLDTFLSLKNVTYNRNLHF